MEIAEERTGAESSKYENYDVGGGGAGGENGKEFVPPSSPLMSHPPMLALALHVDRVSIALLEFTLHCVESSPICAAVLGNSHVSGGRMDFPG